MKVLRVEDVVKEINNDAEKKQKLENSEGYLVIESYGTTSHFLIKNTDKLIREFGKRRIMDARFQNIEPYRTKKKYFIIQLEER